MVTLMTEYVANMKTAQNRVYGFMPGKSNVSRSTSPKLVQNNVCMDSNTLRKFNIKITNVSIMHSVLQSRMVREKCTTKISF